VRRNGRKGKFAASTARRSAASTIAAQTDLLACEEEGRQRLVVELLPLVRRIALKLRSGLPTHIELDDLVGAGSLGLLDAVCKFDAKKKVKIESYARHRIRGAMLDSLRSRDNASRGMRTKSKKVEKVYRDLQARLGEPAGDVEVAQELGISLGEWYRTIRELQGVGLDGLRPTVPVASKPPIQEALVAENQEDAFDRCYRLEQREILKSALARLPQRERLIISLYYEEPRSMKQIAAKLGLDQSRISQLHSAALVRLRKRVNTLLRGPLPAFALNRQTLATGAC
jgi:RNA polymerase sigma factor for flagellar operon FliA